MKKILTIVALLAGLSAYGQSFSVYSWATNFDGATYTVGITNGILKTNVQISSITIANSGATPLVFKLYDSAYDSNNVRVLGYTNRVGYQTTLVDTVIFSNGATAFMTNYYTNTGWRWVNKTVATAVSLSPLMFTYTVPVGETVTVPVDLTFIKGVNYTTTTNGTFSILYRETF